MKGAMAMVVSCAVLSLAAAGGRPVPEYLKRAVVYQVVLRNFTREGDFKAATDMLEHVKSCGVDVVYLTPFVEMDRDMDPKGWSARQVKSGFGSPKNPYRISNYDKIDPEYGTDADFAAFNKKAHALDLKVVMDLVYLHCGPNNVLKDLYPDAFMKNADGTVKMTEWRFPYVNYASKEVRKYLIDSMLHWMKLGCDGFRCDVGDGVPLDFWVEAVTACRKANPELVMINEGSKADYLEKAFDAGYDWPFSFTLREELGAREASGDSQASAKPFPEKMKRVRDYEATIPKGALMFCFVDNHDTAADDWNNRFDRIAPVSAGNAAFVLVFLRKGLPLVFNGNEIADSARNTFFAPVEDARRAAKCVDWGCALKTSGRERLALIRRLAALRHDDPIFAEGEMAWRTEGEGAGVVAFTREYRGRTVLVAANLRGTAAAFTLPGIVPAGAAILAHDFTLGDAGCCTVGPWGYLVTEVKAK